MDLLGKFATVFTIVDVCELTFALPICTLFFSKNFVSKFVVFNSVLMLS